MSDYRFVPATKRDLQVGALIRRGALTGTIVRVVNGGAIRDAYLAGADAHQPDARRRVRWDDDRCNDDIEIYVHAPTRIRLMMDRLAYRWTVKPTAVAFTLRGGPYDGRQVLLTTSQKNTLPIAVGDWLGRYNADGVWVGQPTNGRH